MRSRKLPELPGTKHVLRRISGVTFRPLPRPAANTVVYSRQSVVKCKPHALLLRVHEPHALLLRVTQICNPSYTRVVCYVLLTAVESEIA